MAVVLHADSASEVCEGSRWRCQGMRHSYRVRTLGRVYVTLDAEYPDRPQQRVRIADFAAPGSPWYRI